MASEPMSYVDQAAYKVCERASDYKLAQKEPEFCRLNGGMDVIRQRLLNATVNWECAMTQADGSGDANG